MALTDVQPVITPPKKGGGLFGSVLGSVLGAIAGVALAPMTGGASLAATAGAALSGAGAGMSLGGIAGEVIDPSKAGEVSQSISQVQSKKPKLASMGALPEVQLAGVNNAKKLIPSSSLPPDTADSYMKMLDAADKRLKGRLGIGGTSGQ